MKWLRGADPVTKTLRPPISPGAMTPAAFPAQASSAPAMSAAWKADRRADHAMLTPGSEIGLFRIGVRCDSALKQAGRLGGLIHEYEQVAYGDNGFRHTGSGPPRCGIDAAAGPLNAYSTSRARLAGAQQSIFAPGAWLSVGARAGGR
jgi:hypothetical protein